VSCIESREYICVPPPALQTPRSLRPPFQTTVWHQDRHQSKSQLLDATVHVHRAYVTIPTRLEKGRRLLLCPCYSSSEEFSSFLLFTFLLSGVCYCRPVKSFAFAALAIYDLLSLLNYLSILQHYAPIAFVCPRTYLRCSPQHHDCWPVVSHLIPHSNEHMFVRLWPTDK
jgi:hypothetical protein